MAAGAERHAPSTEEGFAGHRISGHGRPSKRPRLVEEQRSFQDEDDLGCFCANDGCPWHWDGNSNSRSSSNNGSTSRNDLGQASPKSMATESEPAFFDGPLLSVKEYRDRPTGEVRLAVFQGNREGDRRMSVAQILFTLKHRGGRAYGHVKSVRVNRDFRGMGLGPLLFKEVFASLGSLSVHEVRLDAEEDMCKYNRLVKYYENLGFRKLEGSKVHYIHHCDKVFRKVPMCRQLRPSHPRSRHSPRLVDNGSFLVVRLQTKKGGFVRSTADGNVVSPAVAAAAAAVAASAANAAATVVEGCNRDDGSAFRCGAGGGGGAAGVVAGQGGGGVAETGAGGGKGASGGLEDAEGDGADDRWILMMHEVRGVVCFESAYGKYLCVEPDGKVVADRSWDNSWEQFRLVRFAGLGMHPNVQSSDGFTLSETCGDDGASEGAGIEAPGSKRGGIPDAPGLARAKGRFALRTHHGQYLSLDADCGTVSASAQPVLWTTDEKNAICHCEGAVTWADPPPASRRQVALQAYLRSMRQTQNVSFVTGVLKKYLGSFGARGRFSIKDALDRLDHHRDPLQSPQLSRVTLAGLLVLTAEDIRDEGLPDWMQFIGLVHGLGRILHFLGEEAGVTPTERECVLGEYSWVVGAPFPDSIACPSYNADNSDTYDERYGLSGDKPTGMYSPASGLEDALLCFTGPEYMHMVLRHNRVNIPRQGMAMLRLYPLEPWHAGHGYPALESAADRELKESVRQFDAIRRATLLSLTVQQREANLQQSWNEHLGDLVDKFLPGELAW